MRLKKGDRVVLIQYPVGTIIGCSGKLTEIEWDDRSGTHTHAKIRLAKVGTKEE